MYHNTKLDLDYALTFTAVYQGESNHSLREAKCLELQVPYVLEPIAENDLIVGYMKHGFVGLSPQYGGSYTYYYWDDRVQNALNELKGSLNDEYLLKVEQMRSFWRVENTESKMKARFCSRYGKDIPEDIYYYGVARIAGMTVDLDLLVQGGLPGMTQNINQYKKKNNNDNFYVALDKSVEILSNACLSYANDAENQLKTAKPERCLELKEIRDIFLHIAEKPPVTFKQALQLVWIYAVCSDLMNFGRMDNYLGEFYARDVDSGILTEEEAILWLSSFYRNIIKVSKVHDSRIIIGGKGRKNEEIADRLALVLIETSKRVIDVVPQLTLRYYKGINEVLMDKTLDNIASGAVYPIVYSDDTTIPAMEKIYAIDNKMAENWVPFGCGEYVIEGYGAATPNTGAILPRSLDVVLHRGYDSFKGIKVAEDMGDPADFSTFEDLFSAYDRLMKPACEQMAYHEQLNYEVAGEEADFLFLSLLIHDCVETGKPIFAGGCRFPCATSEIFGLITFSDSLMAIKHCVYDNKLFTLPQLVKMIDVNFVGYEKERTALLDAPKYGNDDDQADEMAVRVFNNIATLHEEPGKDTTLYRYNIVSVNNSGSAERGATTSATPCGRLYGEPYSNGNSPSIGGDKNGLTATLNSMSKFDCTRHVGVVNNIRFNKDMLKKNMDKIKLLLEVFYENNGVQTNLSSIGKGELEDALKHPEKYQNLIVRIGGFSARFIELDPIMQHELVLRTTYEAC